MGIFARLSDVIKSNLNDMISRSEDPEKMLNQVIIEMANQLIEAKKGVAEAIAMEKKFSDSRRTRRPSSRSGSAAP